MKILIISMHHVFVRVTSDLPKAVSNALCVPDSKIFLLPMVMFVLHQGHKHLKTFLVVKRRGVKLIFVHRPLRKKATAEIKSH